MAQFEEARLAGKGRSSGSLLDEIYLPEVHPDVVLALTGTRQPSLGEALGIIETKTVPAVIGAADAAVKSAEIKIVEIRVADGLGGKGYALFSGQLHDVEAAVEAAVASLSAIEQLIARVVIPQLHPEMLENLSSHSEFLPRAQSYAAEV